jgi:dolichol-phosphate mannosyltransferase
MTICTLTHPRSKLDFEIIVIDDNSPDGTLEVAKKLQASFGASKIMVRPRPGKLGLGSSPCTQLISRKVSD